MSAGAKLRRWRLIGHKIGRFLAHKDSCDMRRHSNNGLACTCGLESVEEEILLLLQDKTDKELSKGGRS